MDMDAVILSGLKRHSDGKPFPISALVDDWAYTYRNVCRVAEIGSAHGIFVEELSIEGYTYLVARGPAARDAGR